MVYVFRFLVAVAPGNLFGVVKIIFGDSFYTGAHCGGEGKRVAIGGHGFEDFVDALCEAHVEQFVGLVKDNVFDGVEEGLATLDQGDVGAWRQ